jgi:hypothetical protein
LRGQRQVQSRQQRGTARSGSVRRTSSNSRPSVVGTRTSSRCWVASCSMTTRVPQAAGPGLEALGRGAAQAVGQEGDEQMRSDAVGFLVVVGPQIKAARPKPDRAALFEQKDADHDGKLTRAEFLAHQPDPAEAAKRFERFDLNQDGELSRDEFIRMGVPSKP